MNRQTERKVKFELDIPFLNENEEYIKYKRELVYKNIGKTNMNRYWFVAGETVGHESVAVFTPEIAMREIIRERIYDLLRNKNNISESDLDSQIFKLLEAFFNLEPTEIEVRVFDENMALLEDHKYGDSLC